MRVILIPAALAAITAFAAQAYAQVNPPEPRPIQPLPFGNPLYRNDGIRKSLNLTDKQIDQLNAMDLKLRTRYQDDFGKLRDLNDRDRVTKSYEFVRNYYNDFYKSSNDVFEEKQLLRYRQLEAQRRGVDLFLYDSDFSKPYAFTEAQINSLRSYRDNNEKELRAIMDLRDRDEAAKRYELYRKSNREQLNKILNEEQRKRWSEYAGDPYDFPIEIYRLTDR